MNSETPARPQLVKEKTISAETTPVHHRTPTATAAAADTPVCHTCKPLSLNTPSFHFVHFFTCKGCTRKLGETDPP